MDQITSSGREEEEEDNDDVEREVRIYSGSQTLLRHFKPCYIRPIYILYYIIMLLSASMICFVVDVSRSIILNENVVPITSMSRSVVVGLLSICGMENLAYIIEAQNKKN